VVAKYPIVFAEVFMKLPFARRSDVPGRRVYDNDEREPRDVTAVTFPPRETSVG